MRSIALIGLMGSGKSTVGTLLAEKLDMLFVDIDTKIEEKERTTISEIFAQKGEEYFRKIETEILKKIVATKNQIISTGGGAVQNAGNLDLLKQNCTLIYLKTSPEVLFERIKEDSSRPLLQNSNPLETLRELLKKRQENYQKADIIIDTDNKTIDEILDEIIKNVKS